MTALAFLAPDAKFRATDATGAPLFGGQLFTYAAGTVTPIATYTDSTATTPNTNPVLLNARGEANVWLLPNVAYKFLLEDSQNNPIWTQDQIVNPQLALYGGVDTGTANSYLLNFTANFSGYQNGTIIYWVPANSNTGVSTLNVNGLGPVTLVTQEGFNIVANALLANQVAQVMFFNGNFVLLNVPSASTFTGTLTGFTPGFAPMPTCTWVKYGKIVALTIAGGSGSSNSTSMTMTGLPAVIQPATLDQYVSMGLLFDNSAGTAGQALITHQSGTIIFSKGASTTPASWTGSAGKGIGATSTIYYQLT